MDSNSTSNGTIDNSNQPRSTKGYGLKKWRRIPRTITNSDNDHDKERDFNSHSDSDIDSTLGRMLKRGSSNITTTPIQTLIDDDDDDDDSSTAIFNAGVVDSDYSEDSHKGSSKSSTAASGNKYPFRGLKNNSNKVKNVKNSNQRSGLNGGSNGVGFEKEGSPISSFESDSRSCNSVFVMSGGVDRGTVECLDRLSTSVDQGKGKDDDRVDDDGDGDGDGDPLVDSILLLQSAQLALQAEVQKFGEIGKGISSLYDDSDKTSGIAVDVVDHMANGSMCHGCNDNGNLNNSVQTLEKQLNEAECSLKEKELRIAELEKTLRSMESSQDHVKEAMEKQYERCIEMESQLEVLFRQKIEAEVVSILMTRYIKESSVLVEDDSLLAKEEVQSPTTAVDLENKDGHTEKSDTLFSGEEILDMRRGVNKLTKCFVIQLLLLLVVVTLFVFHLAPKPTEVVPT